MSNSNSKNDVQSDDKERQKRTTANIDFATSFVEAESQSTSITMLPPEMMCRIFHNLDSVSRKRAARVCRGWYFILRDTQSLREHVKFDLRYLAPPHPNEKFMEQLCRTVRLFTIDNLTMRMLHFTDESNADTPWKPDTAKPKCASLNDQFAELLRCGCSRLYLDPSLDCGLTFCARIGGHGVALLFEKVVLPAVLLKSILSQRGDCSKVCRVELRDAKIVELSLDGLKHLRHENVCDDWGLTRTVSCCRILCGKGQSLPMAQLMLQLGQGEAVLTEEEEKEYHSTVVAAAALHSEVIRDMQFILGRLCGQATVSREEILDGSTFTPLIKRLIISVKDVLSMWDSYWEQYDEEEDDDDEE